MFKAEITRGSRKGEWVDVLTKEEGLESGLLKGWVTEFVMESYSDNVYFIKDGKDLKFVTDNCFNRISEAEARLGRKVKVGDIIVVKNDLEAERQYGADSFVKEMECFKGKKLRVLDVIRTKLGYVKYDVEGTNFAFTPEMVERIEEEEKKPKFKKGDSIRLKSDLEPFKEYGVEMFVPPMEELKQKELIIENVVNANGAIKYIVESSVYSITEEMIDLSKKTNLKEGNLVEIEDGRILIIIGDCLYERTQVGTRNCVIALEDYDENLKSISTMPYGYSRKYDVTKIAYTSVENGLFGLYNTDAIDWDIKLN